MKSVASLFLAVALICSGAQNAHQTKVSPDASAADSSSTLRVIVQWIIPTGETTSEKITSLGGRVVTEFKAVKAGVYVIPGSTLSLLASDPDVKYVSLDRKVKRKLSTVAAAINAPQVWQSGFIGTGVGVAVLDSGINQDPNLGALKLNKTIVYVQDFTPEAVDAKGHPTQAYGADWFGHGQHVAGIIASNGAGSTCPTCSKPLIGIAPGATLINLKVLDWQGEGSDSQVIAAIDQAITLKSTYNIRVMNLSLGRPVFESYTQDPLCQAVEAAWQAGIVVVTAAGNDGRDNSAGNQGYGTITAPGNDPYVITVGSMKTMGTPTRSDDLIASYSSKGPAAVDYTVKPDIVAPGNLVVSLLAQNGYLPLTNPSSAVTNYSIQNVGTQPAQAPKQQNLPPNMDGTQQPPAVNFGPGYSNVYYTLSGTSMATAVVSGAVADLIQAYPKLTPDQVKILIMQTASKTFPQSSTVVDDQGNTYTDYYDIFTIGAGYLDLQAAMNGASQVPSSGNSLSPMSSFDPTSGTVTVTFDPGSAWVNQSAWSNSTMWGAGAVWSTAVLSGNGSIWSESSSWGSVRLSALSSSWGKVRCESTTAQQSESNTDSSESIEVSGEN